MVDNTQSNENFNITLGWIKLINLIWLLGLFIAGSAAVGIGIYYVLFLILGAICLVTCPCIGMGIIGGTIGLWVILITTAFGVIFYTAAIASLVAIVSPIFLLFNRDRKTIITIVIYFIIHLFIGSTIYQNGGYDVVFNKKLPTVEELQDLMKFQKKKDLNFQIFNKNKENKENIKDGKQVNILNDQDLKSKFESKYFQIKEEFISKISDSNKNLAISLAFRTLYDDQVFKNFNKHESKIRIQIIDLLNAMSEKEIADPDFRKILSELLKKILNEQLEKYADFGGVEEVFITSFEIRLGGETQDKRGQLQNSNKNSDAIRIFENQDLNVLIASAFSGDSGKIESIFGKYKMQPQPERGDRPVARKLNSQGLVAFNGGNFSSAASFFQQGVKADQSDPELINNYAYALLKNGQYKESVAALEKTLVIAVDRSAAWFNLYDLLAQQNADSSAVCGSLVLGLKFAKNPSNSIAYIEDQLSKETDTNLANSKRQALACAKSKR